MASCLLEEIVNDNRSHFIVAHKNDKIIASGWLVKTITHERSFYLESSPEWEKHIRSQEEKRKIKRQTIIFADSDYYFEEYTFDPKDY